MPNNDAKLRTALDLFAGAGGFSCGAALAHTTVVQAVELNKHAVATYLKNNPKVDVINADIRALDPAQCLTRAKDCGGPIDLIIAGPPCQGFSDSNRRTRTLDNPKNHLYCEVLRFAAILRPKCIIIENVAGLKTLAAGTILKAIINGCRTLGYFVEWKVLCAADYGVPQFRNRLFIVASDRDLKSSFPGPTHGKTASLEYVSVEDAIRDLPVLTNGAKVDYLRYRKVPALTQYQREARMQRDVVQGNCVTRSSELILKRYNHIKIGCNWKSIPKELLNNYADVSRCHTGIYYRLKWCQPSKVLGNFRKNMLIHPSQNRGLSVREAARLQSFPDSYEFCGSIGFQQQQVADAVPPLLAMSVIRHVQRAYLRAHKESNTRERK